MKFYAAAAVVCLVLALGSGLGYLSQSRRAPSLNDIAISKSEFISKTKKTTTVDLGTFQLDPSAVLPTTFDFDYKEIVRFNEAIESCGFNKVKFKDPRLQKAATWETWNCGQRANLPMEFFVQPPFFHPFGGTYAARSFLKLGESDEWVRAITPILHVTELELLKSSSLDEAQNILSSLSPPQLDRLASNDAVVRTDEYVWLKQTQRDFSTKKYDLYSAEAWDHFFASASYVFVASPNREQPCVQSEGSGCWIRNERVQSMPTRILVFALTLSVVGMAISFGLLFRHWLRERRRDVEDRRFVLQMLTHELRTPATSLNLNIENIREGFDSLKASQQDAFLRMCSDVQRLKHVIEASTAYLQTEKSDGVNIRLMDVPSINEWIERTIEEESKPVQFVRLEPDRGMRADPYWLSLCLRNLIRNAHDHGAPPVTLRVDANPKGLKFQIRDEGKTVLNLETVVKPFEKQNRSRGLGLGLSIVQQLLRSMNGRLEYQSNPNTFSIVLEDA